MMKANINNLILTRVAVIGEEKGWWNTKFFNESSKAFLNFTFPRSKNVQYVSFFDQFWAFFDKNLYSVFSFSTTTSNLSSFWFLISDQGDLE